MESLGKEKDLDGNVVHQGLSVYGNKRVYVQQLREGVPNCFATFIEVLENREGPSPVYMIVRHLEANQRGVVLQGDRAKPSTLFVAFGKLGD